MKVLSGILGVLLVICVLLLGKIWWDGRQLAGVNDQLNQQLMQADLDKGRALTEFGNAQVKITELETQIAAEILQRQATIQSYGELKLKYEVAVKSKGKTEIVYKEVPGESPQFDGFKVRYSDNRLHLDVSFIPPDQTIVSYAIGLTLAGQLVSTLLPSGGVNHYVTFWEVDADGKEVVKLQVIDFKVIVQTPEEKQWFWWAPHLDIAGVLGVAIPMDKPVPTFATGGSLGFSFFGYGSTINDLDWRVLRLSVDVVASSIGVGITPALYNLGQPLPLISNLWIGPHITYILPEATWVPSVVIGGVL